MIKHIYTTAIIVISLMAATRSAAQPIASYTFTSGIEAYVPISGVVLGDNTNETVAFNDLPIGFTFNYGGVAFATASVSVNGFIKLGGDVDPFQFSPIAGFDAQDTLISVFGAYLRSRPDGELSYTTNGVSPNRTFIVQWTNYAAGSFFGEDTDHAFDFQLRLHETTDEITFHYGTFDINPNGSDAYPSVGLRGYLASDPTDFQTRFADGLTTTWESSESSDIYAYALVGNGPPPSAPPPGLLYTWSPSAPCTGVPTAGTASAISNTACIGRPVQVSLTGSSPYATGITYTWETSLNGTDWSPGIPQTNITFYTTLLAPTYYRVVVACGSSNATSNVVFVDAVAAPSYAAVPITEDFDAPWAERCDPESVPQFDNWSSNPTSGGLAWRGLLPVDLFGSLPEFSDRAAVFTSNIDEGSSTPEGHTGDLDLYVDLGDPLLDYTVSFYYVNPTNFDFIRDSLEVLLSTDGGLSFQSLASYGTAFSDPINAIWNKKVIALGNVTSPTSIVRFRGHSDGSYFYIGVDSLVISGCVAPEVVITSTEPAVLCLGTSAILTASGGTEYVWSTGAITPSITVSPVATTTYTVSVTDEGCIATESFTQVVDACTGIAEDSAGLLVLAPNPTAGITVLRFESAEPRELRLFDAMGHEVMRRGVVDATVELDLVGYAPGMYLLCMQGKHGMQNMRIIRE